MEQLLDLHCRYDGGLPRRKAQTIDKTGWDILLQTTLRHIRHKRRNQEWEVLPLLTAYIMTIRQIMSRHTESNSIKNF